MNRRHFLEAAGATAVATSLAQAGGEELVAIRPVAAGGVPACQGFGRW